MSPQAEAVTGRLEETGRRWWLFSLLTGGVLAACASVAALMLFVAADALLQLSQPGLWVLFLTWVALTAGLGVALFFRHRRGRRDLQATARRVEMECPEVGSHLINLVQLARSGGTGLFAEAAVGQAAAAVSEVRFELAAARKSRRERFLLCLQTPRDLAEAAMMLLGLLAAGALLQLVVPRWASSLERLLHPWMFVPSVGTVRITEVTPGDTEVLIGAGLEVAARIDNPEGKHYPATLFVRREGEPETALPLTPDEKNERYVASLSQVLTPLRYRVEIGGSQSKPFTVGVRQKPTFDEVAVTYIYPPYLGRAPQSVTQQHGDLEAPQFTVARLTVRATTPIVAGHVIIDGKRINGLVEDQRLLHADIFLQNTTSYTIHLVNDAGLTDPQPRVNQARVTPDAAPAVQLVEPGRESTAASGGKLAVLIRATDDHGLGLVRLELKANEEAPAATLAVWDRFPGAPSVVLRHELNLDPKLFRPGQVVFLRAVARDRREAAFETFNIKLGPQEAATPWHQLRIISPEAQAAEELAKLDALRGALVKVLQQQVKARVMTAQVPKEQTPPEAGKLAAEVRALQVEVQKGTVAVVESIGKTDDPERLAVKRAASKLAFGDMLEAVRQAEELAKVAALQETVKPAAALLVTQDRIIDVLRRLLHEAGRETTDLLTEMKKKPATDLPPDVQARLRELRDKLQEFLKQQKKVIEATENLAKKPVEDFTEREEQLLKDLAAVEDAWAKFMDDRHSDLSKLPEQDFANPSLLKELVEVQTELKMAKDALTQKTADIAVPLEQLGAEMAKEMTTNIEKWLPDTPDRERWSQEEPLTDEMKEAPMAELPRELEDLIGELMEQEEDLFDEMEDVSSSWADSLDKGAGWDAMDGPISNMSARGVTGNRLPNTSEIGGRSGEGRQGKSSGEFVGDSAVGKGGQRTPTRLTPDPHVKGQVKDQSKDPTGGATGGGKESGAGGEGLQGPVPDRPQRQMERLAAKQAELRNQAESIDLQFKVANYHRTDLRQLIEQMAAVENDLRAGRYQNALRRRAVVLEGLEQVKTYVKGEFTVRQDQTANLPADIQKEILGSMKEASPAGWEELNRQYFERLGTAPPAGKK